MTRLYDYVGPRRIEEHADAPIARLSPKSPDEIRSWVLAAGKSELELTYVVATDGQLCVSDRHSEHVACARGKPVLAAGELVLQIEPRAVVVVSVSNQSTGYCPEPECWASVQNALRNAGLHPPADFTHAFDFRRCESCGTINILKDGMPDCPNCGADLPAEWNFTAASNA